ncbi:MAG: BMP family ABC transporter substrate-binding protein, partial [Oscillospiraceae bacterium]|nr:BMP family ABC transporter substrate-binding protein [Oscillospiraceae bacterium]
KAFERLGGNRLSVTVADAMLVWLKVYSYEQLKIETLDELMKSLQSVWQDVRMLGREELISVSTAPEKTEDDKGLFGRLRSAIFTGHLRVAMFNEHTPEVSNWVKGHVQGIEHAQSVMKEKISVQIINGVGTGDGAVKAMEESIRQGVQVLFATTAPLIGACRKIAAKYPEVRVLNCSVSMPYTGVRTYYSRIYEGKFLTGAIAGAMSSTDTIGYIASYPIFGVPAAINAFALGAQMTNPRAKIKLLWSCVPGQPLQELAEHGVEYISTLDIPSADSVRGKRGMCRVNEDGSLQLLASPYWDWGTFYIKLLGSIMNGGWELAGKHSHTAVNYWWGLSGGVIGMKYAPQLPEGIRSLAQILQRGIAEGSIEPFHRMIRSRDGVLRNDGTRGMSAEEILRMDWLCENVEGDIPDFDCLLPEAKPIVRMQGIYRDRILPEPEGVLL